jgi:hypothetical protein
MSDKLSWNYDHLLADGSFRAILQVTVVILMGRSHRM